MHFDDIVFIVDNTFLTAKKITSEKLDTYVCIVLLRMNNMDMELPG